jgi:PAS domain S-box-containing protein
MMDALLSLFVNAGDAAFAVDRQQSIVFWNNAASDLLGYDADAATGRFCWLLLQGHTPDDRPYCRPDCPILDQLRRGRACAPFSLRVRHADGTWVPVNVSTLPVDGRAADSGQLLLIHLFRDSSTRVVESSTEEACP